MKRYVWLLVALIPAAASAQVVVGPHGPVPSPGGPTAPGAESGTDAAPTIQAACLALTSPSPFQATLQLAAPVNRAIADRPRMQRLKTLTFDRRPGAVLKAWA